MLARVAAIGFRTGFAFRLAAVEADFVAFVVTVFFVALVTGRFSLSSSISWNVTFFFGAAFATGTISATAGSSFCSDAMLAALVVLVVGLAVRVFLVTAFSFASELTVVAVALVDRVARLGFSANLSTGWLDSVSSAASDFFGRPFVLVTIALEVFAMGSSWVFAVVTLLRVARVAGLASSSVLVDFVSSLSRGVMRTLRRGAAARFAGAEEVVAVALVRGAMMIRWS